MPQSLGSNGASSDNARSSSRSIRSAGWILLIAIQGLWLDVVLNVVAGAQVDSPPATWVSPTALPGTRFVELDPELGDKNRDLVEAYLDRLIADRVAERVKAWQAAFALDGAQRTAWLDERLTRVARMLGDRDAIASHSRFFTQAPLGQAGCIAIDEGRKVTVVHWEVFEGIIAHGLLLEPAEEPVADVLFVGSADETLESIAGVGTRSTSTQVAQSLWLNGCRVLVPLSVSRGNAASGSSQVRRLNTSHREFLWRLSFFVGRHPWGFELATHRAALDALEQSRIGERPLGLVGFADGGDAVLHLASLDSREDAVWLAGSFAGRQQAWQEPIDRCLYGEVDLAGNAELAACTWSNLLVEAAARPSVLKPEPLDGRDDAGTGELHTLALTEVEQEWARLESYVALLGPDDSLERRLVVSDQGTGAWGSEQAIRQFMSWLGIAQVTTVNEVRLLPEARNDFDASEQQVAWVKQWIEFTQRLAHESRAKRLEHWRLADATSQARWLESTRGYRDELRDTVIGRLPAPTGPRDARSSLIQRTQDWTSYEVVMDVGEGMILTGVMVVPNAALWQWEQAIDHANNASPASSQAETFPVVVMQHGRNGRPYLLCDPTATEDSYHAVGVRLAEQGFIVFAPQHLYLGEEAYRVVQRKCFSLGMTMFAPMVRQHECLLEFLSQVPIVNSKQIAFYGKSYGGKSAMLIPAVLEGYRASICSADFNEQVWKHTGLDHAFCFPFTLEYEHTEFDFANRFNYAEIAGLIAPRGFMVERGHDDGVSIDAWVSYEYAPVRRLYQRLGIAERTRIEFFDGGHEINGVGTFEFLKQMRSWPD